MNTLLNLYVEPCLMDFLLGHIPLALSYGSSGTLADLVKTTSNIRKRCTKHGYHSVPAHCRVPQERMESFARALCVLDKVRKTDQ